MDKELPIEMIEPADPFADLRDKKIGEANDEQLDRLYEFWLRESKATHTMWPVSEMFERLFRVIDRLRAQPHAPIDMILYCPNCGEQHIDGHETAPGMFSPEQDWTNPPHRSHLCHQCGIVWRPADVPTNGVAEIKTEGKDDNWVVHAGEIQAAEVEGTGSPTLAERGEVLGAPHPDWPKWCLRFRERLAYQQGIADARHQLREARQTPAEVQQRLALAKAMADKLMGWRLPQDFYPDGYITFDRESASKQTASWPIGTNLFMHEQAVQMLLDIMPDTRFAAAPEAPAQPAPCAHTGKTYEVKTGDGIPVEFCSACHKTVSVGGRPTQAEAPSERAQLIVEYNNDTGPGDEGFDEWWSVINKVSGERVCRCDTEAHARMVVSALASQPQAVAQPVRNERVVLEALKAARLAMFSMGAHHQRLAADCVRLIDEARAALASQPQAEAVPVAQPYCYVYEYDGVFGLHREFYPREWNGRKPDRTIPLYLHPPTQASQPQAEAVPVVQVEIVVPHLRSIVVKHILGAPLPKVGDHLYTTPPTQASQPQAVDAEDAARLDWLDAQNLRFRMGWQVGKAPAGNVSVKSVIFAGTQPPVSIRAAIDAARRAGGGA